MSKIIATASFVSLLFIARPGLAQTAAPPPTQSVQTATGPAPQLHGISAWGVLPWGGLGLGARYMLPLSIQPVLSGLSVRDQFAVELGADLLHYSYGYLSNDYGWTEVLPVVGAMWNLWLNDQFAVYPKLDLGYGVGWYSGWDSQWGPRPTHGGFFWDGAAGLMYKMNNGLTLRAEAGSAGLRLGLGWLF